MMRSLYSGVSGLKNHQTRMDVVGNNISNVNTVGFKSSRVTFADTLSQTLTGASSAVEGGRGGTNPKQIGLGSAVASIDTLFTDGSVQPTGVNTDLCLSGNGLFIVGSGNDIYYTRNGNFKFDEQGNYVNSEGLMVKGWMGNNGVINTTGDTQYINVRVGKPMDASATTTINYTNNLNASEPLIESIVGKTYSKTGDSATPGTPAGMSLRLTLSDGSQVVQSTGGPFTVGRNQDGSTTLPTITKMEETYASATATPDKALSIKLSDGTILTENSGSYSQGCSMPITTTVTVFDSLGEKHDIPIYFVKSKVDSNNGNVWTVQVNQDGSGSSSIMGKDGYNTTIEMEDVDIQFSTDGKFVSGNGLIKMTLRNGATGTQNVTVDLSSLTQYAGSNTAFCTADGNAPGTLKSVSIDSAGVITGTYTNGINLKEAQVAIAQFYNAAGLTKTGNSLYQESNNSGTANVKTAADLGCTITPNSLEMSNVDLASELTDMIVTQRGYQSNSKIITVSDELLENLINMKR